jgi:hypothetical protein
MEHAPQPLGPLPWTAPQKKPDALVQTSLPGSEKSSQGKQEQPLNHADLIAWYIERIHKYTQETAQLETVPMLEKAQTIALLMQAEALQRIAVALESIEISIDIAAREVPE